MQTTSQMMTLEQGLHNPKVCALAFEVVMATLLSLPKCTHGVE